MKDPFTFDLMAALRPLKSDPDVQGLEFPRTLDRRQRSIVHTIAQHAGLNHVSYGIEPNRQIIVSRLDPPPPVTSKWRSD